VIPTATKGIHFRSDMLADVSAGCLPQCLWHSWYISKMIK